MGACYGFGLTSRWKDELSVESRLDLCKQFIGLGFTDKIHEVINDEVYRISATGCEKLSKGTKKKYIRLWHGEIGGHNPRTFMPSGSGPYEFYSDLYLTAEIYVETKKKLPETVISLPGTPLDGLKVGRGGDCAISPWWDIQKRIKEEGLEVTPDFVAFAKDITQTLAINRSVRFVVWIS